PSWQECVEALDATVTGERDAPGPATPESWLQPMRRVGPDGYQLLHRLTGVSAVGQFWEAVARGGKHVALQVIENLDRDGVVKHLRAFDLARCFVGSPNVLQVYGNWLASAEGAPRSLANVLKLGAEEHVAFVVVQELADEDLGRRLGGSRRKFGDECLDQLLGYLKQAAHA